MQKLSILLAATAATGIAVFAYADKEDKAERYEMKATVVSVQERKVIVEKEGGEKAELQMNKDTKIDGDLAEGAQVKVSYVLEAKKIEVK